MPSADKKSTHEVNLQRIYLLANHYARTPIEQNCPVRMWEALDEIAHLARPPAGSIEQHQEDEA